MRTANERRSGVERPCVDHRLRWLRTRNDAEYLFSNRENAVRLNRAIDDSLTGRTHEFTMDELYARYGRERKA